MQNKSIWNRRIEVNNEQITINIGDIYVCAGTSASSSFISGYNKVVGVRGEAAEMTHVAMAAPKQKVWESTTGNVKWAGKSGTQENAFDDWIENYRGRVWVRKLWITRNTVNRSGLRSDIAHEQQDWLGTPYEAGIPGFWELLLCIPRWNYFHKTGYIHCTQAACEVYKAVGLVDPRINSSNMPPYTFWTDGAFEEMLRGCHLSDPVQIKG
jgi:hypothetical protein